MRKNKLLRLLTVGLVLFIASSLASGVAAYAQQDGKTVTVTVSDDLGPVVGAGVVVKGTTNGVVTGMDGKAVLNKVPGDAVILVSCLGYVTQEIKVGTQSSINVTLAEDTQTLDDVIVIGYGTAKRKDYTGSVASVKLEDSPIALTNNLNALESVKGNVAGLDIGATNSAGGQPSMQIRGQKSISSSANNPLIVVDGVIFLGSLNDINPNDIASYDVLKDATSAAAYGSRSANGVIVITTKKGRSQKPVITLNASGSMQLWGNKPQLRTPEQWIESVMARNNNTDLSWLTAQETANKNAGKSVNWLDESSRTGWVQDYQLAVSGATEKVNYYLSTAYSDNQGIIVGDDFNRISLLGKLSTDITSWLQVGVDAGYAKSDYSGVGANLQYAAMTTPYGAMYRDEANGLLEKYPQTQGLTNPLWDALSGTRDNIDKRDSYRLNAYTLLKCPWIDGLTFRVNYAGNITNRKAGDFYYETYYVAAGAVDDETRYSPATYQKLLASANGALTNYETRSWVLDNILNYKQTFGRHSVDLTAVATRDRTTYDWVKNTGSNFAANGNTTLGINGLPKATVQKIEMDGDERANIGYLGRAMYSFDDRYFLTGSFRRDGASVFGVNKKWGNFAAAGLAWKVSNESFYPAALKEGVLNSLKLKASWGMNGNQSLAPYGTFSTVTNGSSSGIRYEFSGSQVLYGLNTSALGNADLGWESTTSWNAGFESVWFNERVFFDVDAYYSQTKDQIFSRDIPVMTGFKKMSASMGQIDNRGIEANLRTINVRNQDFNWTTNLIFWLNRNKLVHLYGEDLNGDGLEDDDISGSLFIGESINNIFGYRQDGIVQESDTEYISANGAKPGSPKYVDIDGNKKIDGNDREILGYRTPSFRLNMSNTFTYKNLELYFMLIGTFGGKKYYLNENTYAFMVSGDGYFNSNGINIPWWTPENKSNTYTEPTFSGDGRFLGLQSRTFVRLQDITLSYNLRSRTIRDYGISGLKVFVSGKNLFTLTNWVGADPETGAGVKSGTYPVLTSFTLGANISF